MEGALEFLKNSNNMLNNFNEETDFVEISKKIYKNCKYNTNLNELNDTIIDLRRLLKFQYKIFEAEFNIIFEKFTKFINNKENEQILENILILFNEIIFSKSKFGLYVQKWFDFFLPEILKIYYFLDSNLRIKLLIEILLSKINEDEITVNCYINVFEKQNEIDIAKIAIVNFFDFVRKFNRTNVIEKFDWKRIFQSIRNKTKEYEVFFYNEFKNTFNNDVELYKIVFITVDDFDIIKFKQMNEIDF
jgi:hypothetical protein